MGRYRKFLVALLGAIVNISATFPTPDEWKPWVAVAVAILTALGVYRVPNEVHIRNSLIQADPPEVGVEDLD